MPSAIAERLKQDVIAAMKAKDKDRLGVLRMLQSALKQVEVDERKELQDEDVLRILQSYAKRCATRSTALARGTGTTSSPPTRRNWRSCSRTCRRR